MPTRIDEIDVRIVRLLQEDGRMPVAEVARRLGDVTERIVRHRIKRLVESQVIAVSAVVNPAVIGFPISADVWVETNASDTTQVAATLTRNEQVSYIAYSTGDRNISLQVHAPDLPSLTRLVNEVISKTPGVSRTTVTIIPFILKDIHQWEIPASIVADRKEADDEIAS
jgi:Lrp/AsnC family transcriptional regulator for asnA, asnC and gidA